MVALLMESHNDFVRRRDDSGIDETLDTGFDDRGMRDWFTDRFCRLKDDRPVWPWGGFGGRWRLGVIRQAEGWQQFFRAWNVGGGVTGEDRCAVKWAIILGKVVLSPFVSFGNAF